MSALKIVSEKLAAPYNVTIIDEDVERLQAEKEKAWNAVKDRLDLKGFRKGKVPRSVAEGRFDAAELYKEVVDAVLQKGLEESGLSICNVQSASIINWQDEQPLEIQAVVDVNPQVLTVEYKGVKHTATAAPQVTEEQIDAMVQRIRESLSVVSPLAEDQKRPAQNGDIVTINFKGTIKGKPFEGGQAEDFELKLGSNTSIAGFEDGIVGLNEGEATELDLVFPKDYGNKRLAKKKVHFSITLIGIKAEELPDIDDELAVDAGYDDMETMRTALKQDLEKSQTDDFEKLIQAELLQKVVAEATIDPIPAILLQRQLDNILRDIIQGMGLRSAEDYFKQTKLQRADFDFQYRDRALEDIKARLVLDHIATLEGFVPTEDERKEYIRTNASKMNVTPAQFQKYMSRESIDMNIRLQRAGALIVDRAELTYEPIQGQ